MRRAPIVLVATATGLAAVLGFDARRPETPATTSSSSAAAAPPTSTGQGATSGTATGEAVDTPYGAAQVRVTVADGRITGVEAVQLQGNDPKSVAISSAAEPLLRESALSKQSADVDVVSGATFTSASYAQSRQSALDKLGFEAADGSRATLTVPEGGHDGR
jgi:uncharacterized protein with FMN-binding domain